jgi:hypothetical protein
LALKNQNGHGEYRYLYLFTQLGFAVISPILCSVFTVLYLNGKWELPDIVTVLLILLGIAAGLASGGHLIYKITKPRTTREEEDNEPK